MKNLGGKRSALWGIGNRECTGHVVLPGTPEHRNITEHSGTTEKLEHPPKNPEHSQGNPEHPKKTRNTPQKARNTPRKPGTPRKQTKSQKSRWRANMLPRAGASLNYCD